MVKKTIVLGLAMTCLLGSSALAVPWYKVGDLGYTTSTGPITDSARLLSNAIATDGEGNIYATCMNNNNTVSGGLTVFSPSGTKLRDVNLNTSGYAPGVTKMVKGGDGAIYALQNWREIGYSGNKGINRVIRIDKNGTVTEIANGGTPASDTNQLSGLTVDPATGAIYWTKSGAGDKNNYLWKYDPNNPGAGNVNVRPAFNNGWSDTDRLVNLEYTGNGYFSIINSGGAGWGQDPISEVANRVAGDASNPGWGRDHATATAYDAATGSLWTGARGGGNRLILTRWNGLNTSANGIASGDNVWHALGDSNSDGATGYTAWVSGLTADNLGNAYMGFGINNATNSIWGMRGHVVKYDSSLAATDLGLVQTGADIAAVGYLDGKLYATVVDRTTGIYSLYFTPEPTALLLLGLPMLLIRRRRA